MRALTCSCLLACLALALSACGDKDAPAPSTRTDDPASNAPARAKVERTWPGMDCNRHNQISWSDIPDLPSDNDRLELVEENLPAGMENFIVIELTLAKKSMWSKKIAIQNSACQIIQSVEVSPDAMGPVSMTIEGATISGLLEISKAKALGFMTGMYTMHPKFLVEKLGKRLKFTWTRDG